MKKNKLTRWPTCWHVIAVNKWMEMRQASICGVLWQTFSLENVYSKSVFSVDIWLFDFHIIWSNNAHHFTHLRHPFENSES